MLECSPVFFDISANPIADFTGDFSRRLYAEVIDVGPALAVAGLADFVFVLVGEEEMLAERVEVVVGQPTFHAK